MDETDKLLEQMMTEYIDSITINEERARSIFTMIIKALEQRNVRRRGNRK